MMLALQQLKYRMKEEENEDEKKVQQSLEPANLR